MKIYLTNSSRVTKEAKENYHILWIGTNIIKRENVPQAGKMYAGLSSVWLTSQIAINGVFYDADLKKNYSLELSKKHFPTIRKVLKSLNKDIILVVADNQTAMLGVLEKWFNENSKKIVVKRVV